MNDSEIDKAVAILRAGGLVAFPTETVYGLGADAANPEAVRKLYAAKGRPDYHPVIVHLAGIAQLPEWVREVTPAAQKLAQKFWPGPLTLILKRKPGVGDAVTGGQETIGVRIPAHPLAHALLEKFGGGIAAPSANRFGHVSATTAQHVKQEFGDSVDFVLDGGQSEVGIESTIVDVTGARPVLLRPGHISAHAIEQAVGEPLAAPHVQSPRAPGMLATHYAPYTPMLIITSDLIHEQAENTAKQGKRVAVLALSPLRRRQTGLEWVTAPRAAVAYAHQLYANLRVLDALGCAVILVEQPPRAADWAAVNDRLDRAAAGSRLP